MSLTVKPTHLSHFCNSKNKNRKEKLEVGEEVFVSQKFPFKRSLKPVARNVNEGRMYEETYTKLFFKPA